MVLWYILGSLNSELQFASRIDEAIFSKVLQTAVRCRALPAVCAASAHSTLSRYRGLLTRPNAGESRRSDFCLTTAVERQ